MGELFIYIGFFLSAFVISCVLLGIFKTILEKKKIENISDKNFDNWYLIIQTIFILICIWIYYNR